MVIELRGVQFGLKSYTWFQNQTSAIWKRVRFEITSMISDQNCTTRGSITALSHPFWNHPNTGLGNFKYFIDAVLSRTGNLIHPFWGGGGGVRVLETKVAKFATWYSLSSIFLQFDRLFKQTWNLLGCFVLSVATSLAGKKMRLKATNGVIRE